MSRVRQFRRVGLLLLLPLLIGAGVAWHFRLLPFGQPSPRQNSLLIIAPYRKSNLPSWDHQVRSNCLASRHGAK